MGNDRLTAPELAGLRALRAELNATDLNSLPQCREAVGEQAREEAKVTHFLQHSSDGDDPMFIVDIGAVAEQMNRWRTELPAIKPFYAVKCNPRPEQLKTLIALNSGFDCASKGEIQMMLDMGVDPKNIVYANPCKQVSHIKFARENGVTLTTLDNECEVEKLQRLWPEVNVLLRIATDDSAAICQFSSKFGATLDYCPKLIQCLKERNMNLMGVSFHVGSGCQDATAFVDAASNAALVFDMARKEGFEMRMLDIGGGFPGDEHSKPTFEEIARPLSAYLDEKFRGVEIIAEPGRYFACRSHSLAAHVFGKRVIEGQPQDKTRMHSEWTVDDFLNNAPAEAPPDSELEYQYYVNDGTYQSFNCIYFDHAVAHPYPLPWDCQNNRPREVPRPVVTQSSLTADTPGEGEHCTTIFGPTCDALDCIAKRVNFPSVEIGDWIYFANMGAYTCAAASQFNGFYSWRVVFCTSLDFGGPEEGAE